AQTTLTHNEFEARTITRLLPNDDRLKYADLANAVHEFGEQILVKDRSGLTGIGIDEVDRDLAELCVGNRLDFVNGFLVRFLLGRRTSRAFVACVLRRFRRSLRLASLFISRRRLVTQSGCLMVVITSA